MLSSGDISLATRLKTQSIQAYQTYELCPNLTGKEAGGADEYKIMCSNFSLISISKKSGRLPAWLSAMKQDPKITVITKPYHFFFHSACLLNRRY
jgi:hypothetical protein